MMNRIDETLGIWTTKPMWQLYYKQACNSKQRSDGRDVVGANKAVKEMHRTTKQRNNCHNHKSGSGVKLNCVSVSKSCHLKDIE